MTQHNFSKGTVTRLLKYITKYYKLRFSFVLIMIIVSSAASVAGSLFLQILIDDYIVPLIGVSDPVFSGLFKAVCIMGIIYLSGVVTSLIYNRQMVVIGQGVQKKIRDEMFSKMEQLPIRYFDTNSYGDIMSHYTNDIDTLRQMISQSIPMLFSSLVSVILVFFGMIYTSLHLTVIVLILTAIMIKCMLSVAGKSSKYFVKQQSDLGNVNGYIEEMMNGQKVVKTFSYEEDAIENFTVRNDTLFESADSANKYANILMPLTNNIANAIYVIVAIVGGAMTIGGMGGLTIGAITSFLQLTKQFNMPISQVSQQTNSIIMAFAGAERIFKLIDEEPEDLGGEITLVNGCYDKEGRFIETEDHTDTWAWKVPSKNTVQFNTSYEYVKVNGHIEFKNVDFSYNGEDIILHDISFTAKPGEKIAFIGATGAGKTTITNLINRFYDIDKGTILYDGIDINRISKNSLRSSLGIVLQDTNLFSGTVMDNLKYGRPDTSDYDVIDASRNTGAHSFISRLPDGYETYITGDDTELSQGQRQLLSITRAAVADPPVLILDEATSSIDTRTEKIVQDGMDSLMHGRTSLVIAHRLSTIKDADEIMVLDKGCIVERGNHDDLIDKDGFYAGLYTGMFETADEFYN